MKPEHFVHIKKYESCEDCDYMGEDDKSGRAICILHDFVLPSRLDKYRCDDFKEAT